MTHVTLAEFLLARIAEDEEWAVKVGAYLEPHEQVDIYLSRSEGALTTSEKIPAVTPARVLAECEAKRRIIALHKPETGQHPDFCGHDLRELPCPTLRALALPYADHPDYQPEWKP